MSILGYLVSFWRLFEATPVRLKLGDAARLIFKRIFAINGFLGLKSSGFVWFTSIVTSFFLFLKQDHYNTSYLMDSRYRFIYLLENDPLKKSLIHGYGARGIALARLDDPAYDEELNELARQVALHEEEEEDPDASDQSFTTIKVEPHEEKFKIGTEG